MIGTLRLPICYEADNLFEALGDQSRGTVRPDGSFAMYISDQSLIVILLVGLVAGWLAGQIVRGGGFGLVGDIIVGVLGAFVGNWMLPRLGIHVGVGRVAEIVDATIGAIVLLLLLRLMRGPSWRLR
jgi:uncharacterized membrane protein YeaQ/YmgE (transglycosylase-associated protein family)